MDYRLIIASLVVVVLVNGISIVLWFWLMNLVAKAGNLVGSHTAYIYTKYLYSGLMESMFYQAPKMMALGNPDRDPVIRAVRQSEQFETIGAIASWVRVLPVNVVPFFV